MRRAGQASVVDVGPIVRSVVDPDTLVDARVTARLRVVTAAVDTGKLVAAQHAAGDFDAFDARVAAICGDAVFSEIVSVARRASASLADAASPALRARLEASIRERIARDLSALGLGVVSVDDAHVALDAGTEAYIRSRRASARVPVAAPVAAAPDEPTEVAGLCQDCGAQVATLSSACPSCGGTVARAAPCGRCGAAIRPASRFCVGCGASVTPAR